MARGDNCYLCGDPILRHVKADEMVLDRKPRRVHPGCRIQSLRAWEELEREAM